MLSLQLVQKIFIILFISTAIQACDSPSDGWMIPSDDTYIEVNSIIYCGANDIQNVQDLKLVINDRDVPFSVYNKTTINLTIPGQFSLSSKPYNISCLKYNQSICSKSVYVGYKPQNVTNFQCISYNLDSLICTWDTPYNPITTTYIPLYTPASRPVDQYLTKGSLKPCPYVPDSRNCTWSGDDYVWKTPFIKFIMKSINALQPDGQIHPLFVVNHYGIVIPKKMADLHVLNVTSNSVTISWVLPTLFSYPNEFSLVYNITYKEMASWSDWSIQETNTSAVDGRETIPVFSMLMPHANVHYEISVRARSSQANASEEKWWSEPAIVNVTSLPEIPCSAPEAAMGSFQVNDHPTSGNRSVTLLWSPVAPECENGDQFQYLIEAMDSKGNMSYEKTVKTEFVKIFPKEEQYIFKIKSLNIKGVSQNSSVIFLPKASEKLTLPGRITQIFHNQTLVEINWQPDNLQNSNITEHSVFYCRRTSDGRCKDKLHWKTISSSQTSVNIDVSDSQDYGFAVASGQNNLTSGLIWFQCSINMTSGEVSQISSIDATDIRPNDITFQWTLPCIEKNGFITGYYISYCSTMDSALDSKEPPCSGELQNITVDSNVNKWTISNLRSSTTYKIQISVMTQVKNNTWSKPLIQKTKQEAMSSNEVILIASVSGSVILVLGLAIIGMIKYKQFYNKINKKTPQLPWESKNVMSDSGTQRKASSVDKSTTIIPDYYNDTTYRSSTSAILSNGSRFAMESVSTATTEIDLSYDECSTEVFVQNPVPEASMKSSDQMNILPTGQLMNNWESVLVPNEESFSNFVNQQDRKIADQKGHLKTNVQCQEEIQQQDLILDTPKYLDTLQQKCNTTNPIQQDVFPEIHSQLNGHQVNDNSIPKPNGYVTLGMMDIEKIILAPGRETAMSTNNCDTFDVVTQSHILGDEPSANSNEEMMLHIPNKDCIPNMSQDAYVKLGEMFSSGNRASNVESEADHLSNNNIIHAEVHANYPPEPEDFVTITTGKHPSGHNNYIPLTVYGIDDDAQINRHLEPVKDPESFTTNTKFLLKASFEDSK